MTKMGLEVYLINQISFIDTSDVVKRVASKLRQEFSKFNLKDDTPCPARKAFRTDPLVLGKVVLRPDTTLDKTKVCQFLVG